MPGPDVPDGPTTWWKDPVRAAAAFTLLGDVGFQGEEWNEFWEDAAIRLNDKLVPWCRSGVIFDKLPFPIELEPSASDRFMIKQPRHYEPLLADSIAEYIYSFQQEKGCGWDPGGGRSLPTFMTYGVLYKFANEFRKWQQHQRMVSLEALAAECPGGMDLRSAWATVGPSEAQLDLLAAVLDRLSAAEQKLVMMMANHRTYPEMADVLSCSRDEVERRVTRLRRIYPWLHEIHVARDRREEA